MTKTKYTWEEHIKDCTPRVQKSWQDLKDFHLFIQATRDDSKIFELKICDFHEIDKSVSLEDIKKWK